MSPEAAPPAAFPYLKDPDLQYLTKPEQAQAKEAMWTQARAHPDFDELSGKEQRAVRSQVLGLPELEDFLRLRTKPEEIFGPVGQSALASGLTISAFTPPHLKLPAFAAGFLGDLLTEEGTRRLQEHMGAVPGFSLGTSLAILASLPLYKIYPNAAWVDLIQEGLDAIPVKRLKELLQPTAAPVPPQTTHT